MLVGLTLCFARQLPAAVSPKAAERAAAGWTAYEGGRYAEARTLLQQAVRMDPAEPDYVAALGLAELKTGEREEGKRHLKRAILLKPGDEEFVLQLASAYQDDNDDLTALKVLQSGRAVTQQSAGLHFTRGFSLFRLGRLSLARQELEPLAADSQLAAPANFILGSIAFSENRLQEAATYFDVAVRLGNTDSNIAYNAYTYDYGLALFQLGRFADAETQFKASIARFNRDPLPWMFLGRCEQAQGNYREAIENMEHAVAIDPALSLAYYDLARLQQKYGDPHRAAELFEKVGKMKEDEIAVEQARAMRLKAGAPRP